MKKKEGPLVVKELLSTLPKNLTLFLVPAAFLTGGGLAVVVLWTRKEEAPPKKESRKTPGSSQAPK